MAFLNTDTNPSLHITSPAQPGTLHLFPWSAIFAVVLACFFTIPAELLMVQLAAGLEHGRVYANVGGVTISDPDCYVTVCVMFWFAYFSVVFFIHEIYIRRRKQWCLRLTLCNFLLFNYAKVNTVFHSMAPLKEKTNWTRLCICAWEWEK